MSSGRLWRPAYPWRGWVRPRMLHRRYCSSHRLRPGTSPVRRCPSTAARTCRQRATPRSAMRRWKIATFAGATGPGFGSEGQRRGVAPEKTITPARFAVLADRGGVPLQYRARAADHRLAHETILNKDNRVMSTVEQQVKAIVAEQLGVKAEQVTNDASFVDDLGADSLDTVELVMALEEEFEIEIPDEDAEKITTVQQAIDYINERRSKA